MNRSGEAAAHDRVKWLLTIRRNAQNFLSSPFNDVTAPIICHQLGGGPLTYGTLIGGFGQAPSSPALP
ncbi:MAG: hypothetical protein E5Y29_16040 [Mesorhizobium sp.]|nr:MAG: hypothetical protein E5Y29_16040 [Mesorhizobium sp.]